MDFLTGLLSGMEVAFPLGFTIILALALYVLGNKIKRDAEDPKNPTPLKAKYSITRNNVLIGIGAAVIWMLASYFTAVGFVFAPIILQYILVGAMSGIVAAGFSTTAYQIIKGYVQTKAIKAKEESNESTTSGDDTIAN